ncbi:hypothetical protein D6783_05885 [Candidatus Woesearchaeota archaeon]|nr:MAG: hypothetical protein D6783_05885 [Candidatus Woesearchaeota archaeon]
MGKPVEGGKVKVRADFYVCPACAYRVQKKKYEEGLQVHILYVCPACGKKGEVSQPFVRKTFQGVKAIVFSCEACKEKIPITKKLKDVKKK